MKVKELIDLLRQENPEAKVVTLTLGNKSQSEYTSNPKVSRHSNRFGEKVFIT